MLVNSDIRRRSQYQFVVHSSVANADSEMANGGGGGGIHCL